MKKVITTISVYEIIMILILSSDNACNSILCMFSRYRHCDFCEYHGFQYLVMCLFIPIIIALIWWWRDEIKKPNATINKKTQDNNLSDKELTEKLSTARQSNKNAKVSMSDDTGSEKKQEDEKEYGWQYWD